MAGAKEEDGRNAEKTTELIKHKEYFVCRILRQLKMTEVRDRGISDIEQRMSNDERRREGILNIQYRTRNFV